MKQIIFGTIVIFATAFTALVLLEGKDYRSEQTKIMHDNITQVLNDVLNQVPLKFVGLSDKRKNDGSYEFIDLTFTANDVIKKPEARELILLIAIKFLNKINYDPKIRPYLVNYPFTFKNIRITIRIPSVEEYPVYYPLLAKISTANGIVRYSSKNSGKRFGYLSEVEETCEEALNIIHNRYNRRRYERSYPFAPTNIQKRIQRFMINTTLPILPVVLLRLIYPKRS